ncbi:MAG: BACON domain-containing protein [Bacteroidales bacterium]|nr:BACON domain-containing protein [Bacteroidales bacterium]
MKRHLYNIIMLLALALPDVSCQQKYQESWNGVQLDSDTYSIAYDAEKIAITIWSTGTWTAQIEEGSDWLTLVEKSGIGTSTLHCTFTRNLGLSRRAVLQISDGGSNHTLTLVQKAGIALPQILMLKNQLVLPKGSYKVESAFVTNLPKEYLGQDNLSFDFGGVQPWISEGGILEKEDTVRMEDIPGGRKKYFTYTLAANSSALRSAQAIIGVKDASGAYYGDTLTVVQTSDAPFISNPSTDILNQPGGVREVPLSTNLEAVEKDFVLAVEYPQGQAAKNFISDCSVKGGVLSYTVAPNTGDDGNRTASIRISYTDLDGVKTEAVQQIQQTDLPESFDNFIIKTLDQLLMWNRSYSSWSATDKITLDADIDMSTVSDWTPHEFVGTFDGGGHRLYNLLITAGTGNLYGLFSKISGNAAVSDLIIGSAAGTVHDGVSALTVSSNPSSAAYIGALAGQVTDNASISNITNYASVNLAAQPAGVTFLGGLVGDYSSSKEVSSCSNLGKITSSAVASGSSAVNIGGLMAQISKNPVSVRNCSNYGSIAVNHPSACNTSVNYGGITGYTNVAVSFNGCINGGAITITPSGKSLTFSDTNVGGIIGYVNAGSATPSFEECTNSGDISNWCGTTSSSGAVCIGGIVGKDNALISYTLCSNSGDLAQGETPDDVVCRQIYIGGILGKDFSGISSVSNCNNEGAILVRSKCMNEDFAGGMAGSLAAATTIKDCGNTGNITNNGTGAYVYFGGMAGLQQTSGGDITGCTNSADIVNTGEITGGNGLRFGGIVGQVRFINIDRCIVTGDVISSTTSVNGNGYCNGIVGLNNGNACSVTNCKVTGSTISANHASKYVSALVGTDVAGTTVRGNIVGGGLTVGGTLVTAENFSSLLASGSQASAIAKSNNTYTE